MLTKLSSSSPGMRAVVGQPEKTYVTSMLQSCMNRDCACHLSLHHTMVAAFPMLHWSMLSFLLPRTNLKASLAEQSCCKVQGLSFL